MNLCNKIYLVSWRYKYFVYYMFTFQSPIKRFSESKFFLLKINFKTSANTRILNAYASINKTFTLYLFILVKGAKGKSLESSTPSHSQLILILFLFLASVCQQESNAELRFAGKKRGEIDRVNLTG